MHKFTTLKIGILILDVLSQDLNNWLPNFYSLYKISYLQKLYMYYNITMKKCGKIGFKIESILNAALLLSLMKGPSYGYSIPDNLKDFGINPEDVQYPVIYRLLKDMELNGLVKSKWEFEKSGPSKKVYFITNKGKIYLKEWKSHAKIKFEAISKILNQIAEESNG